MNFLSNIGVAASSTIGTSLFVTLDPTQDYAVYQSSGVTPTPIAISQAGTEVAPGLQGALFPGTTPNAQPAARVGDGLQLFGIGDVCWLTVGAAVTPGQGLTSDVNGRGVPATSGQNYMAIPLSAGQTGELVTVIVIPGRA